MTTAMTTTLPTAVGDLHLLSDGAALTGCWFGEPGDLFDRIGVAAPRTVPDLGELSEAIRDYLDGDVTAIDGLPVQQAGSTFRQSCWQAMRDVPAGETISYAELARRAGSPDAVRAAGGACARNVIALVVPCHRIVTSAGTLGGYAYGLDAKRWLLAHERGQETLGRGSAQEISA